MEVTPCPVWISGFFLPISLFLLKIFSAHLRIFLIITKKVILTIIKNSYFLCAIHWFKVRFLSKVPFKGIFLYLHLFFSAYFYKICTQANWNKWNQFIKACLNWKSSVLTIFWSLSPKSPKFPYKKWRPLTSLR